MWMGHKVASHAGGIDGFSSFIARYPSDNAVVIVLTNNTSGMANVIGGDLQSILFGQKYDVPRTRSEVKLDGTILDGYVGKYEVAPSLVFNIVRADDGLTFQPTGQPTAVPMYAESESAFFLKVVDAQITFIRNESGKVTGMEFRQSGRTTKARRVE
jgi:hypothetical protein